MYLSLCVYVSVSCFVGFFFFFKNNSDLLVLFAWVFFKEKENGGVELGAWGGREDLGGEARGEAMMRTSCMKK